MIKIACRGGSLVDFFNIEKFYSGENIIPRIDFNDYEYIELQCFYENDSDLFFINMFQQHLNRIEYNGCINLFIPYLPYSRMDRHTSKEFEQLELMKSLLTGFHRIVTFNVHNPMTISDNEIFENQQSIALCDFIINAAENGTYDGIVFPDKTAYFRYPDLEENLPYVFFDKVRTSEGVKSELLFSCINENRKDDGLRFLIVDDICSLGRTFIEATENLKSHYRDCQVDLLVDHVENGILVGNVFDHVGKVFTTDSLFTEEVPENLKERLVFLENYRKTDKFYI